MDCLTKAALAPDDAPPAAAITYGIAAYAARTARPGDYFDERWAAHAIAFFETRLVHTVGRFAGQRFVLQPWQRELISNLFGWRNARGDRRFRRCYVEIARKNGKTTLAAGIALYLAFACGENAAEVYCAASDKDQAAIVFREAQRMRAMMPDNHLRNTTQQNKFNIHDPASFSRLQVVSSESSGQHGLNVSGLIGDEMHAWKDRDLYDVLSTGTASEARRHPLEFLITTAGVDQATVCGELHEEAQLALAGERVDPEFLPVIFAASPDDPIDDPATWAKANPSLGETVSPDYLASAAMRALRLPSALNAFKRLHLNIWTEVVDAWFKAGAWNACNLAPVSLDDLAGRECWAGMDLSSTTDLTALCLIARRVNAPGYDVWWRHYMPAEKIAQFARESNVPYDLWVDEGFIVPTHGNVVDYDIIRRDISGVLPAGADATALAAARANALVNRVRLVELARDPWNATQISTQLMGDGVKVIDMRQGFASLSDPSKQLERLIDSRQINHGGNKLVTWMASCVSIATDAAGNIKPVKPARGRNNKRIDGIVALIMALARANVSTRPAEITQAVVAL